MNKDDLQRLTASLCAPPTILGRRNYTDAAVIVPLIETGDEYHLLFEQRSAHIPQGSEICFPGGEFDPAADRSLRETAVRETAEELGIDPRLIDLIGLLGTAVALRGIAVDCFVAKLSIASLDELSIDQSEVGRVFTLPVAWFREHQPERYPLRAEMHPEVKDKDGCVRTLFPARELGLPQRYWRSWQAANHTVLAYRTAEGTIWGMTAQVVEELLARW